MFVEITFKAKEKKCFVCLILHLKKDGKSNRSLWIWEVIISSYKWITSTYWTNDVENSQFGEALNNSGLCNESRLLCKLIFKFDSEIHHIQWSLKCPLEIGRLFSITVKVFNSVIIHVNFHHPWEIIIPHLKQRFTVVQRNWMHNHEQFCCYKILGFYHELSILWYTKHKIWQSNSSVFIIKHKWYTQTQVQCDWTEWKKLYGEFMQIPSLSLLQHHNLF